MGGIFSQEDSTQSSQNQWNPAILQKTLQSLGMFEGQVKNAQGAANSAAAGMNTRFADIPRQQTNFQQYAGGLNQQTHLGGPLDARSEQQLGAMRGDQAAQAAAQAGQMRGVDPRVAAAINSQGRNAQALAGNTNRLQLAQSQDQRLGSQAQMDAQRAQVLTGLGQASNQASLQGAQAQSAQQVAGNNALAQQAQTIAAPASLMQGLISSLGQVGQGTGTQVTTGSSSKFKL